MFFLLLFFFFLSQVCDISKKEMAFKFAVKFHGGYLIFFQGPVIQSIVSLTMSLSNGDLKWRSGHMFKYSEFFS